MTTDPLSEEQVATHLDSAYARKGTAEDTARIVRQLRLDDRHTEAAIVVGLFHGAVPFTDKTVAAYLFGKVWEGGTTGKVARWTNVINALRAAVIGDRNEEDAAKRLTETAK